MSEHLDALVVGGYVDGSLLGAERRRAEQHLAECAECRTEIADVARLVRPRRRSFLPLVPLVPLAAAAAAVVLVIGGRDTGEPRAVLRSGVEAPAIVTTRPAENESVGPAAVFAWHAHPEASEYRVTVTNAAGDVVAERLAGDTTTMVELARAASFRWYVTAILEDGSTVTSAVHGFRTR